MTARERALHEMREMEQMHLRFAAGLRRPFGRVRAVVRLLVRGSYFTPEWHEQKAAGDYRRWLEALS